MPASLFAIALSSEKILALADSEDPGNVLVLITVAKRFNNYVWNQNRTVVKSIERLLARLAANVSDHDLQQAASLDGIHWISSEENQFNPGHWIDYQDEPVDCAVVNALAKSELARRGVAVLPHGYCAHCGTAIEQPHGFCCCDDCSKRFKDETKSILP
jgi:hypothetical protein